MVGDISQAGKSMEALSAGSGAGTEKTGKSPGGSFEKIFEETARNLEKADQAALQANTGGPVDLHDVMIAMEKADISLKLLVQVRNKAVDAYKEIMRMQV